MNPRRPLTAVLLTAAAVATLAVPAGAAVPKRPARQAIPCNDGSGKSAQVWNMSGGRLAAKNPCLTQWLTLAFGKFYASGAPDEALQLAPGVHFNWSTKQTVQYTDSEAYSGAWLTAGSWCGDASTVAWIYSYKDVRDPTLPGGPCY